MSHLASFCYQPVSRNAIVSVPLCFSVERTANKFFCISSKKELSLESNINLPYGAMFPYQCCHTVGWETGRASGLASGSWFARDDSLTGALHL